jgi:UPF0755 protein
MVVLSFPTILSLDLTHRSSESAPGIVGNFPVTVDPRRRAIVEDHEVNEILEGENSPLVAAVSSKGSLFSRVFTWVAVAISDSSFYQLLASANGSRFVNITPGMRREQVANAFAKALRWTPAQKKEFLTATGGNLLPLPEGSFAPGVYTVDRNTTPRMAQALVNDKFSLDFLERYGTTTAAIVPLHDALVIASLIEREAGGAEDMRYISGIIWNRLFRGMKLQIDATLQHSKATALQNGVWWPKPVPNDRFRKSVYNTYQHVGLPPQPIASPSVASVLAALNPKSTPCLFYFHDDYGGFHCSETYEGHVAKLKSIYGRGK